MERQWGVGHRVQERVLPAVNSNETKKEGTDNMTKVEQADGQDQVMGMQDRVVTARDNSATAQIKEHDMKAEMGQTAGQDQVMVVEANDAMQQRENEVGMKMEVSQSANQGQTTGVGDASDTSAVTQAAPFGQQGAVMAVAGGPQAISSVNALRMAASFKVPSELVSRSTAIRMLRVSMKAFASLGLEPGKVVRSPYKGIRWTRLYRRSDIEGMVGSPLVTTGQCRKYVRKDYEALFRQQYSSWRDALPDACRGLVELDHYCGHRSCKEATKRVVYDLKTELAQVLYDEGGTRNVYCFDRVFPRQTCWACAGSGRQHGRPCNHCDGTGVWRPKESVGYVQFEFCVAGQWYSMRLPRITVLFGYRKEVQLPVATLTLARASGLKPMERTMAKKLVQWVLSECKAELQAQLAAVATQLAA